MKSVQNLGLADTELIVSGMTYKGDALGIFSMPDEKADMLAGTPGWTLTDVEPVSEEDVDPVAALREGGRESVSAELPAPPAPTLDQTPAAPPAPEVTPPAEEGEGDADAPTAPEGDGPDETPAEGDGEGEGGDSDEGEGDEGPDLDAATTKKALFAIADEWGCELSAAQKKMTADEIRVILDAEIYPATPED